MQAAALEQLAYEVPLAAAFPKRKRTSSVFAEWRFFVRRRDARLRSTGRGRALQLWPAERLLLRPPLGIPFRPFDADLLPRSHRTLLCLGCSRRDLLLLDRARALCNGHARSSRSHSTSSTRGPNRQRRASYSRLRQCAGPRRPTTFRWHPERRPPRVSPSSSRRPARQLRFTTLRKSCSSGSVSLWVSLRLYRTRPHWSRHRGAATGSEAGVRRDLQPIRLIRLDRYRLLPQVWLHLSDEASREGESAAQGSFSANTENRNSQDFDIKQAARAADTTV